VTAIASIDTLQRVEERGSGYIPCAPFVSLVCPKVSSCVQIEQQSTYSLASCLVHPPLPLSLPFHAAAPFFLLPSFLPYQEPRTENHPTGMRWLALTVAMEGTLPADRFSQTQAITDIPWIDVAVGGLALSGYWEVGDVGAGVYPRTQRRNNTLHSQIAPPKMTLEGSMGTSWTSSVHQSLLHRSSLESSGVFCMRTLRRMLMSLAEEPGSAGYCRYWGGMISNLIGEILP